RSQSVLNRGVPTTWEKARVALNKVVTEQKATQGAGLRVLTGATTSPSTTALLAELKALLPKTDIVYYDPVNEDNAWQGAKLAFGKYLQTHYRFAKANVVVSLDSDFLGDGIAGVQYSREAMSRRKLRVNEQALPGDGIKKADDLSRIYSIESMMTGVSGAADHRIAVKPSEVESFVRALAAELGVSAPAAGPMPQALADWVKPVAADLKAANGAAIVVPGRNVSAIGHALAHAINGTLGAIGKTVEFTAPTAAALRGPAADKAADQVAGIKLLVSEMNTKQVQALLILGGNPAYTAPVDLKFTEALANVPFKLHLGAEPDETAYACDWHVNQSHELETWGDVLAVDGTATVQQPLIAPMFNGKSTIEMLAAILDKPEQAGQTIVKATWQKWFLEAKKGTDFD
ncbi:MAG: molybdopterin oxidoreductase, partial [Gemmataceae bacterium]